MKEQLPDALAVPGVCVQLLAYIQFKYEDEGSLARANAIQFVAVAFGMLKLTVTELPGLAVVGLTLMSAPDGDGVPPDPDPDPDPIVTWTATALDPPLLLIWNEV